MSTREEMLARRLTGEDVAQGRPEIGSESITPVEHPDGDVKIGKSLRVPMAMFADISEVAARRGISWSALVREWITIGLAAEQSRGEDPVKELRRDLTAALALVERLADRAA